MKCTKRARIMQSHNFYFVYNSALDFNERFCLFLVMFIPHRSDKSSDNVKSNDNVKSLCL